MQMPTAPTRLPIVRLLRLHLGKAGYTVECAAGGAGQL